MHGTACFGMGHAIASAPSLDVPAPLDRDVSGGDGGTGGVNHTETLYTQWASSKSFLPGNGAGALGVLDRGRRVSSGAWSAMLRWLRGGPDIPPESQWDQRGGCMRQGRPAQ